MKARGSVWGRGPLRWAPVLGAVGLCGLASLALALSHSAESNVTAVDTRGLPLTITTRSLPAGVVGSAYQQSLSASGGFAPYAWTVVAGALPTELTLSPAGLLSGSPSAEGRADFTVQVTDAANGSVQRALSIVVYPRLAIRQRPPDFRAAAGGSVSLTVLSEGPPPLAYVWRHNERLLLDGDRFGGCTTANLRIEPVQSEDAGSYTVTVSQGTDSVTSTPATQVAVVAPVEILVPPRSQSATLGGSVSLSATVVGTGPLVYQWRLNGVTLPGQTAPTLLINPVTLANVGSYAVVIENELGVVESAPALITVQLPALGMADAFEARLLVTTATGLGAADNRNASQQVGEPLHAGKPGGRSLWLAWRAPNAGIATFRTTGSTFDTLLAVYTGATLVPLPEVTSDEDRGGYLTSEARFNAVAGTEYAIAVDGYAGAAGVVVLGWELAVTPVALPVITRQPESQVAVENTPVTFTVEATGPGLTFQWLHNGAALANQTATALLLPAVTEADAGAYAVGVTNSAGLGVRSDTAQLEVRPKEAASPVLSRDKLQDLFTAAEWQDAPPRPEARVPKAGGGVPWISVAAGEVGLRDTHSFGATTGAGEPSPCEGIGGASRWFRFRVAVAGRLTLDTTGSEGDTLLGVYTNRHALVVVACNDNAEPGVKTSQVSFEAAVNEDYLAQVDTVNGKAGAVRLNWALENVQTPVDGSPIWVGVSEGNLCLQRLLGRGRYELELSVDLEAWQSLFWTNLNSGLLDWCQPVPAGSAGRFYRLNGVR